ncbi:MAG: metallophosphoesterase [Saprospiraceae bacterium]
MVTRRKFITDLTYSSAFLLSGGIRVLHHSEIELLRKKSILRFALISDGHYGQPNTLSDEFFDKITQSLNLFHKENPLHHCFVNGDIIHDDGSLLQVTKLKLDKLAMPYYVTKGNHDKVSDAYWEKTWKMPVNIDFKIKKNSFLLMTTSNEKGEYLSPDLAWLEQRLEFHKKQKNVFLVLHIPQAKWTSNAIDTPAFFTLLDKYPNIRAGFHGHEHDQDGVKMHKHIPFLFDSHFGGNWGTEYKGFRVVELLKDNSLLTYIMNPTTRIKDLVYK